MVDTAVVGKFVGEDAVAAVGSSFPIVFLSVAVASGLSMGCNVVVSPAVRGQAHPRDEDHHLHRYHLPERAGPHHHGPGDGVRRPSAPAAGHRPGHYGDSRLYLRIYFGGAVFLFLYNTLNGIYNAQGDSKTGRLIFLMSPA